MEVGLDVGGGDGFVGNVFVDKGVFEADLEAVVHLDNPLVVCLHQDVPLSPHMGHLGAAASGDSNGGGDSDRNGGGNGDSNGGVDSDNNGGITIKW